MKFLVFVNECEGLGSCLVLVHPVPTPCGAIRVGAAAIATPLCKLDEASPD